MTSARPGSIDKVYLHSVRCEFAPTESMPEAAYLGRMVGKHAPLGFVRCGCTKSALLRVSRSPWMRLLPFLRQYLCTECGARVLRLRTRQRYPYGSVYLPATPLRCESEKLGAMLAGSLHRHDRRHAPVATPASQGCFRPGAAVTSAH
jgi:hypothetical protein